MNSYCLYEKDKKKRIGRITLNKPERLNVPSDKDLTEFTSVLRQAEQDDDVKVVIIKGAGSCFCAGFDLSTFFSEAALSADPKAPRPSVRQRMAFPRKLENVDHAAHALSSFTKVSIVQAHGYCYGFGLYIISQCDIIIASEEALIGHPALRYVGAAIPIAPLWADIMGINRIKEMVFTGRPFTAQEMYQCGLVNKVVPREKLEEEVEKVASACAIMPLDLIVVSKQYFEVMQAMRGASHLGFKIGTLAEALGSFFKTEPDDFDMVKESTLKGVRAAAAELDARYPPDYRVSYSGREGKK